jgi:peroxiredoxin
MRPAAIMERIETALAAVNLTEEQKQQVNTILSSGRQQMRGAFQEMNDGQPAARRGRMQEMSDALVGKIRGVLTEEQTRKFDLQLAQASTPQPNGAPTSQPSNSPPLGVVLERLRDYLDQVELNSDQKLRMEGLFTETRGKLKDLQARGGDAASISQQAQVIVQQLRQQINGTLTPQQLARFREIVAQNGPVMPGREGAAGRAGRGRANVQAMPQNNAPNMQGMQDMAGGMQNDMAGGMQGGMQNDMSMGGANRGNATPAKTAQPTPEIPMLEVGATAPDFELKKLEGTGVSLASFKGKLVLVVFGSYSSPSFRQRAEGLEALRRDYGARITPIIVYTRENHPVGEWDVARNKDDGVAVEQPANMDGRIAMAKQARGMLKLTIPIAVDAMEDTTAKAYGGMTNAAFLIGRDGKIVARQKWFEPYAMRRLIDEALKEPAKAAS